MYKILVLALLCSSFFLSDASATVKYRLSMNGAQTHYFDVEMLISNNKAKTLNVSMPVWAPGSYLVREFSKSVEGLQAIGSKELILKAIDKNTWSINTSGQSTITIKYRVYAFELSVRTSFVDESHAYINGTSVFMFINGKENDKCELEISPYKGWNQISTGLKNVNASNWNFSAKNYDELVDCPIEIGTHKVIRFEAGGIPHELAIYGESNCDVDRLKKDLVKIIDSCTEIFGELPIDKYVFIIHNLDRRGGGLEHMNSTTLQFNRWSYEPESSYLSFMSLALHEYFHLWNVKRLRPIELGPFDYENENHTELLWVMEGVTSYYDEYLMLRTGLINKHNYLDRLEGNINAAENRPGNEIQSLAHSSFYAWIKSYRPNENSMNTSVSYYGKGSVVAALLDLEIRKSTKGEKSLDDLMKYLYNLYYKEKQRGMTSAEFKLGAEHISGEIMDEFFYKNVYGTGRINYSKYFKDFGISILDVNTTELKAFLGLNVSEKNGKLVVNNVHRESPAYFAGFSANDEIIAINDNRVNSKVFRELISFENPGAEITVLLSRMGLLMEKKVKLSRDKSVDYVLMENQTEELNLLKNGWLGTE